MLWSEEVYRGFRIRIESDDDALNPRLEFDNVAKMVCFHQRYVLGDKTELKHTDFSGWDELDDYLRETCHAVVMLPVYAYIHSGIKLSFSRSCPWDSGRVGTIYIDVDSAAEFPKKENESDADYQERLCDIMRHELAVYNAYLAGEVYQWVILYGTDDDDDEIDRCGGFYGDEQHALADARSYVDRAPGGLKE